ncbi:DUF1302 domain-containing protein [Oxalobacteraceae bacterium A2-2]
MKQEMNRGCAIAISLAAALSTPGMAAEIDTGNPELKLRWDNTVKYSAAWRLNDPSARLTADANLDDGDRNFGKGLISSRVDLLSEFDLTYGNLGARVSGAAWYDQAYNRGTDNNSPYTYNPLSVGNGDFTRDTRDLHGRKGELLDAFLFAKGEVGDMPATVRLGRHALVYGESLFFGNNGIAAAQQPIDVVKALSVPNTQFKELIRPVGQLSGQLQLRSNLSLGAYYQYRWEASVLPAAGSYFSGTDFLGEGGERLFTGPASADVRGRDLNARDSGQGGMQLRWTPEGSGVDLGFYAARYHDKTPQIVIQPLTSTYVLAYQENIKTYGASFSTTLGEANFAGEVSVRRNTALVNAGSADLFGIVPAAFGGPTVKADNSDNPSYPVGNSAHAQVSVLASLGPSFISQEASLAGEVAWNRRTSITRNAQALDPNASRDAWGVRVSYEPNYRQVLPGLDLSVPLGLSYFPKGRSSVVSAFGTDKGGDMSIGLNGVYLSEWNIGLAYTHYYGAADTVTKQVGSSTVYTYKQNLKDRDFVSLTVRKTF